MLAILLLIVAGVTAIAVLISVGSSRYSGSSKVAIVIVDTFCVVVEVLAALALM